MEYKPEASGVSEIGDFGDSRPGKAWFLDGFRTCLACEEEKCTRFIMGHGLDDVLAKLLDEMHDDDLFFQVQGHRAAAAELTEGFRGAEQAEGRPRGSQIEGFSSSFYSYCSISL